MKNSLTLWGLILLIGFGASHWALGAGQVTESVLWMAWGVIFLVGHCAIGKTYKKMPKEMGLAWMTATVFGTIATFAVALGYLVAPFAALMALWLILVGAVQFATSAGMKGAQMWTAFAVIFLFLGVSLPAWFPTNYFLAGALIFGVPTIIQGWLSRP